MSSGDFLKQNRKKVEEASVIKSFKSYFIVKILRIDSTFVCIIIISMFFRDIVH